jgi:hypothetical protein
MKASAKAKAAKAAESIIERFREVHGDLYTYMNMNYINNHTKIEIQCNVEDHGTFWQTPSDHSHGKGCRSCSNMTAGLASAQSRHAKAKSSVLTRFEHTHGGQYDYSNLVYTGSAHKVEIGCKVGGHGTFWQIPTDHLKGSGCPLCAGYGFQKGKPGVLYYLRITISNNVVLYKIGITNRSVEARFGVGDLKKIEVVWTKPYKDGMECYNEEQRLLMEFKHLQYTGEPVLASGNTELFTEDVLCNYI